MTEVGVTQYLTYWRHAAFGGRDILEGLVAREHDGPSPCLAQRLAEWDGYHYWEETPQGRWLILVRETAAPRTRWWLHALLLAAALLTTSLGGAALLAGPGALWSLPTLTTLRAGLPFALPLIAVLLAHESGHYYVARRYKVDATPPYFIPFPPQLSLLGTMGAVIRIRSPIFDRRTLFDIGAAGPLAGLLVAIPILLIGVARSTVNPVAPQLALAHQYVRFWGQAYFLGDSLLLQGARAVMGVHGVLLLSPLALAGWAGILVTMINLLPLAQLDGGHVAYALFGRGQTWIARVFWVALLVLGWRYWFGWYVWAAFGLLIGRGRLSHPAVVAPERTLDPWRRAVGWIVIALFIVTFMPLPAAV